MDYPSGLAPTPVVVNSFSKYFVSPLSFQAIGVGTTLNNTNPGLVALHPFTMTSPYLISSFFWANGTTISGNSDIGIYSSALNGSINLIVSAGAVAQSGANTLQIRALGTPYLLQPGSYFLALTNTVTGQHQGPTFTALQGSLCGIVDATGTTLNSSLAVQRSTGLHYYLCGFSRLASGY